MGEGLAEALQTAPLLALGPLALHCGVVDGSGDLKDVAVLKQGNRKMSDSKRIPLTSLSHKGG